MSDLPISDLPISDLPISDLPIRELDTDLSADLSTGLSLEVVVQGLDLLHRFAPEFSPKNNLSGDSAGDSTAQKILDEEKLPGEIDWQLWLTQWLKALDPQLSPIDRYEVSLVFTDDMGIADLNATYRQIDQPTDVLAFAALEDDLPGAALMHQSIPVYLGDVIISVETAVRQRSELGHSLKQELRWLAVHGFLHLLGWDHPDDERLEAMLAEQHRLLTLA
jgi:probable rRNA maturation factor